MIQEAIAIQFMEEHGSATVQDLYPFMNSPTKVLSNLWKKGLITKANCSHTNQSGETKYFTRYFLRGETK